MASGTEEVVDIIGDDYNEPKTISSAIANIPGYQETETAEEEDPLTSARVLIDNFEEKIGGKAAKNRKNANVHYNPYANEGLFLTPPLNRVVLPNPKTVPEAPVDSLQAPNGSEGTESTLNTGPNSTQIMVPIAASEEPFKRPVKRFSKNALDLILKSFMPTGNQILPNTNPQVTGSNSSPNPNETAGPSQESEPGPSQESETAMDVDAENRKRKLEIAGEEERRVAPSVHRRVTTTPKKGGFPSNSKVRYYLRYRNQMGQQQRYRDYASLHRNKPVMMASLETGIVYHNVVEKMLKNTVPVFQEKQKWNVWGLILNRDPQTRARPTAIPTH